MKIEVFDPPMCCSTGLCGPAIDPKLIEFAANLDWLKQQGIVVERYNLSQQPALFVANQEVSNLLKRDGNACLPVILLDGKVAAAGIYPSKNELAQLAGLEVPLAETPCSSSFNLTIKAASGDTQEDDSSSCCGDLAQESCCDETNKDDKKPRKSCCS